VPREEDVNASAVAKDGLLGALRDVEPRALDVHELRANASAHGVQRLSTSARGHLRGADPDVVHADDGRSIRVLLDGVVTDLDRLRHAAALARALAEDDAAGPYRPA
jgi:hypothetical protein